MDNINEVEGTSGPEWKAMDNELWAFKGSEMEIGKDSTMKTIRIRTVRVLSALVVVLAFPAVAGDDVKDKELKCPMCKSSEYVTHSEGEHMTDAELRKMKCPGCKNTVLFASYGGEYQHACDTRDPGLRCGGSASLRTHRVSSRLVGSCFSDSRRVVLAPGDRPRSQAGGRQCT